jgi:hypothetical protein
MDMVNQQIPPLEECCGGTCRLAAIARMSRDELIESLINVEESEAMGHAHILELHAASRMLPLAQAIALEAAYTMGVMDAANPRVRSPRAEAELQALDHA